MNLSSMYMSPVPHLMPGEDGELVEVYATGEVELTNIPDDLEPGTTERWVTKQVATMLCILVCNDPGRNTLFALNSTYRRRVKHIVQSTRGGLDEYNGEGI